MKIKIAKNGYKNYFEMVVETKQGQSDWIMGIVGRACLAIREALNVNPTKIALSSENNRLFQSQLFERGPNASTFQGLDIVEDAREDGIVLYIPVRLLIKEER